MWDGAGGGSVSYTLVEPCCGSSAFTLHLLGATRSLLPYQGSKWRFRHGIQQQAEALGFVGSPSRVVLTDPGPWGRVMGIVVNSEQRRELISMLDELAAEDPRAAYDRLHGSVVPEDAVVFAAEFLFLQRLSFSGKAVGCSSGRWASPGFNSSSAYGLAPTERFGEVKPMVPSLIGVLRGLKLRDVDVEARQEAAAPPTGAASRTLVYLDPPYADSTRYPDGSMDRDEVVALAAAWRFAGAAVMVSEQHGVPIPSWSRGLLNAGRQDTSPFRGKQQEWLTYAGAAR
jgi:hypothetical protein